jgi:hypothetical protein
VRLMTFIFGIDEIYLYYEAFSAVPTIKSSYNNEPQNVIFLVLTHQKIQKSYFPSKFPKSCKQFYIYVMASSGSMQPVCLTRISGCISWRGKLYRQFHFCSKKYQNAH